MVIDEERYPHMVSWKKEKKTPFLYIYESKREVYITNIIYDK